MPDQAEAVRLVNDRVAEYFKRLELPDEPNLYDILNLAMRDKDAILTFNWDPFLVSPESGLLSLGFEVSPSSSSSTEMCVSATA